MAADVRQPDTYEGNAMTHYRVWLRSKPGPYAQYDGKVDVWAEDTEQARSRAFAQLRASTFPDRPASMWTVDRIEVIG